MHTVVGDSPVTRLFDTLIKVNILVLIQDRKLTVKIVLQLVYFYRKSFKFNAVLCSLCRNSRLHLQTVKKMMLAILEGHGFNPVSPVFNDWVLALLVTGLSMVKPELGNLSSFTVRYLVFLLRILLGSI